ncbi:hypothetical protein E3N88_29596 [Mikania micrantha]|uniref:Transposase-associated domain-containing protein n=1 Tax=Mikania micrantha TaxID=192012 RepID=A0A5N6MJN6_9ASTR|nr:hypothetical protein E3N88_29596 [Mikania micrantha]
MTPQWWIARGAGNCLRWKYRWVNILRLELYMTPQWWIARGAGNCLRWKYRWVNILRLELYMTPQWWIARGAGNCLRWKYRWVNILRLELYMTPQWWIARGAGNWLWWKHRNVKNDVHGCKDRGGLGIEQINLVANIRSIFNIHGIWEAIEPKTGTEVDKKKNNVAIALLYQAIPENMVLQIANLTSAKEIWEALKANGVNPCTVVGKLAKELYANNQLDLIIDLILREQMSSMSGRRFSSIGYEFLQEPDMRPTMEVVKKELEEMLEIEADSCLTTGISLSLKIYLQKLIFCLCGNKKAFYISAIISCEDFLANNSPSVSGEIASDCKAIKVHGEIAEPSRFVLVFMVRLPAIAQHVVNFCVCGERLAASKRCLWVNTHGETAREIKCPCYKCQNISYRDRATVQKHLCNEGFMLRYETWSEHGENYIREGEKDTSCLKLQAGTSFLTWKPLFNVCAAAYNYKHVYGLCIAA